MIGSGPIFLFTMHRSGGTLLQRVINAHPGVVIWGEHGGFINQLAEADANLSRFRQVMTPVSQRNLAEFVKRGGRGTFDPWIQPFERSVFRRRCRELIFDSFSVGVPQGARWGFKEIRYHSLITARFLAELFPHSRFVLLRRDLKQVIASTVLAPWSLGGLTRVKSREEVEHVVQDCAHAACAMQAGLVAIATGLQNRAHMVDFSDLAEESCRERLFEFLALTLDDTIRTTVARVCSEKLGATPYGELAGVGREEIEAIAETAVHKEIECRRDPPRPDYRYLMGWRRAAVE